MSNHTSAAAQAIISAYQNEIDFALLENRVEDANDLAMARDMELEALQSYQYLTL